MGRDLHSVRVGLCVYSIVHRELKTCLDDAERMRKENQFLRDRINELSTLQPSHDQLSHSEITSPTVPRQQNYHSNSHITLSSRILITGRSSAKEPTTPLAPLQSGDRLRSRSAPPTFQSAHHLMAISIENSMGEISETGNCDESGSEDGTPIKASVVSLRISSITDPGILWEPELNAHHQLDGCATSHRNKKIGAIEEEDGDLPIGPTAAANQLLLNRIENLTMESENTVHSEYPNAAIPTISDQLHHQNHIKDSNETLPPLIPIIEMTYYVEHPVVSSARQSCSSSLQPPISNKYRSISAPPTFGNFSGHLLVSSSQIPTEDMIHSDSTLNSTFSSTLTYFLISDHIASSHCACRHFIAGFRSIGSDVLAQKLVTDIISLTDIWNIPFKHHFICPGIECF